MTNILYLECDMGASGDMLLAALCELLDNKPLFLNYLNNLGLSGVSVSISSGAKCGLRGSQIHVLIDNDEEYATLHKYDQHRTLRSLNEIFALIDGLNAPIEVLKHAQQVYKMLAEAEATSHGCPVSEVHFHEIGMLDAIMDITGVCLALHLLAPERIVCSPLHTGYGQVHCAHGLLPIPAPATAELLRGIPCSAGVIEGELLTPTGAALLRHFVDEFNRQPLMNITQIGCGLGKKDFSQANCLRAFWGKSLSIENETNSQVTELSCNLDDMSGEDISFAIEQLFAAGALDVLTIPVQMKKQRPGQILCCFCRSEDADHLAKLILRHTSSFGVRRLSHQRYELKRETSEIITPQGAIKIKTGYGYGVKKSKPEYEDLATIARNNDLTLNELRHLLDNA